MKEHLKNFGKGMIVGVGAIAPGLSGSILLVIFGLYQRVVAAVSHIWRDFKKNILFLVPLFLGIGVGIVLFSNLIKLPLKYFPMQTYYAFLGLILGTIPMLWQEVRKEGFAPKYYIVIAVAFAAGFAFFYLNRGAFPDVTNPGFFQSLLLGLAVAAAYLIPGVDSFAILSSFGLYDMWIESVSTLSFSVLIPAAIGVAVGGIAISVLFNLLFSRLYTGTYSAVFGLFAAVILNFVLRECPPPTFSLGSAVALLMLVLGFCASLVFSRLDRIVARFRSQKQPSGSADAPQ